MSTLDKSKQLAHCHTNSSYWMIDVSFSPDGKRVVTLCDTIEVITDKDKVHMSFSLCATGTFTGVYHLAIRIRLGFFMRNNAVYTCSLRNM